MKLCDIKYVHIGSKCRNLPLFGARFLNGELIVFLMTPFRLMTCMSATTGYCVIHNVVYPVYELITSF